MPVLFTAFFLLFSLFIPGKSDPDALKFYRQMMKAMQEVKTLQCTVMLHERIGNKFLDSKYSVKVNVAPYKLYAYSFFPHHGAEAIYAEGTNNGKAVISPKGFPFVNVHFGPQHMILRRNHHYTILDFGFMYMTKMMQRMENNLHESFHKNLSLGPDVIWNGNPYYQLIYRDDDFCYKPYKVSEKESLTSIADKFLTNDSMILLANKEIESYTGVKAGQTIQVPSSAGKKLVFYLDKKTLLPYVQFVFDDKGLFGRYEMADVTVNPVFTESDFSTKNKNYGF